MPRKLLLADDSVTIQKVVAIVFAHEDYQVTAVANGEDAIARAKELQPDIVLADVLMPGKDGYQVCEALKADPATRHIPVILLAGTFEPFDEARAAAAGYDGQMPKPFESARLLEKVRQLVEAPRGPAAATTAPPPARQQPTPLPSASAGPAAAIPAVAPSAFPAAARPAAPVSPPPAARPPVAAPVSPFAGRPSAPAAARPPASVILPPRAAPAPSAPLGGAGFGASAFPPPAPAARPPMPAAPPVARPAPAPIELTEEEEILLDVDEIDFADVEEEAVAPAVPVSTFPTAAHRPSLEITEAGRRSYGGDELRAQPVAELEAETTLLSPGTSAPTVDLSELDAFEGTPATLGASARQQAEPVLGSPVDDRLEAVATEPARAAADAASFLAAVERTPAMRGAFPQPAPQAPAANTAVPAIAATPIRAAEAGDGGEAALRAAIGAASREVIEKIAWEVVPQLAEVILREHVERLVRAREGRDQL